MQCSREGRRAADPDRPRAATATPSVTFTCLGRLRDAGVGTPNRRVHLSHHGRSAGSRPGTWSTSAPGRSGPARASASRPARPDQISCCNDRPKPDRTDDASIPSRTSAPEMDGARRGAIRIVASRGFACLTNSGTSPGHGRALSPGVAVAQVVTVNPHGYKPPASFYPRHSAMYQARPLALCGGKQAWRLRSLLGSVSGGEWR
jgi:hypothetical protein